LITILKLYLCTCKAEGGAQQMKGPQMERTTRRWSSKNEGSQMEGTANGEQEDKI